MDLEYLKLGRHWEADNLSFFVIEKIISSTILNNSDKNYFSTSFKE